MIPHGNVGEYEIFIKKLDEDRWTTKNEDMERDTFDVYVATSIITDLIFPAFYNFIFINVICILHIGLQKYIF